MFIFLLPPTPPLRVVCVQNLFTFLVWNNVATMNALQQQHKQVLLTYWLLGGHQSVSCLKATEY